MKLALARAMLLRADILLLDEPTNHLDTTNVAWLENYLITQPNITCMIVSHDRCGAGRCSGQMLYPASNAQQQARPLIRQALWVQAACIVLRCATHSRGGG